MVHSVLLAIMSFLFIGLGLFLLFWYPVDWKTLLAVVVFLLFGGQGLFALLTNEVSWFEKIGPLP